MNLRLFETLFEHQGAHGLELNPLLLAVDTAMAGVRNSLMSCIKNDEQVIISIIERTRH